MTHLGPDIEAIDTEAIDEDLYDIGLNRPDARFCVRAGNPELRHLLESQVGNHFTEAIPALTEALLGQAPTRVIETMAGRMEITTALPKAGKHPPMVPHTHLTLKYILRNFATPASIQIPSIYAAGAIFYPSARTLE